MKYNLVECYIKDHGWIEINFKDLKVGMLFRMFDYDTKEPIKDTSDGSVLWVVTKKPSYSIIKGFHSVEKRNHLVLVKN